MRRAIEVRPAGGWPEAAVRGTVTLAYDDRHRRRVRLSDDAGEPFLLDLERATQLMQGDGLKLEHGGWLRVQAAPEPVADVMGRNAQHLARLAWHLGNRHVPLEVLGGRVLRIRRDHVLEEMLVNLGAIVHRVEAAFSPEKGAYHGAGHGSRHPYQHEEASNGGA